METFIVLYKFTAQGIKNIKDSPSRIDKAKELFKSKGVHVKAMYGLLGEHDTMFLVEAPNAETLSEVCLKIGSEGNVKTHTIRAFTEEEYRKLIEDI